MLNNEKEFAKDFRRVFNDLAELVEFSKANIDKNFNKEKMEKHFQNLCGTYYSRLLNDFENEIKILFK